MGNSVLSKKFEKHIDQFRLEVSPINSIIIDYQNYFEQPVTEEDILNYNGNDLETFNSVNNKKLNDKNQLFIDIDTVLTLDSFYTSDEKTSLDTTYTTSELTVFGKELKDKYDNDLLKNKDKPIKITFLVGSTKNLPLVNRLKKLFGDKVEILFLEKEDENRLSILDKKTNYYFISNLISSPKYPIINPIFSSVATFETVESKINKKKIKEEKKLTNEFEQKLINLYNDEKKKEPLLAKISRVIRIIKTQSNISERLQRQLLGVTPEEYALILNESSTNLALPLKEVELLEQVLKKSEKNQQDFFNIILNFYAILENMNMFFSDYNKQGQGYKKIIEVVNDPNSNFKQLQDAATELYNIRRMSKTWLEYVQQISVFIGDSADTKEFKELIDTMRVKLSDTNIIAVPLIKQLISKTLLPYLNTYKVKKKIQIEDLKTSIETAKKNNRLNLADKLIAKLEIVTKEYESITEDRIIDILEGKEPDLDNLTIFTKTLINSSNGLLGPLAILVNEEVTKVDLASIQRAQLFTQKISEIKKQYGLSDNDYNEITDTDFTLVFNREKKVWEKKPIRVLLHAHKGEAELYFQLKQVKDAQQKWHEETNVTKKIELEKEYKKIYKKFLKWKQTNFYSAYTKDFYDRYNSFLKTEEDQELFDEILFEDEPLWTKYNAIRASLLLEKDEKIINAYEEELEQIVKTIKNKRSVLDENFIDKNPREKRKAKLRLEKTLADKKVYYWERDFNLYSQKFIEAINEYEQYNLITPAEKNVLDSYLSILINPENSSIKKTETIQKLFLFCVENNFYSLVQWFNKNTAVSFTDDFFAKKKSIIDGIKDVQAELNKLINDPSFLAISQDLSDIWEEIFIKTSEFRNDDSTLQPPPFSKSTEKFFTGIKRLQNLLELGKKELSIIKRDNKNIPGVKDLIEQLNYYFEELSYLQSKEVTSLYLEEFENQVLSDKTFPKEFTDSYDNLRDNEDFLEWVENNPTSKVSVWFNANHYSKEIQVEDKENGRFEIKEIKQPIYIWMSIQPSNDSYIEYIPTFKYSQRLIKEEFLQDKNKDSFDDNLQEWKPKTNEFNNKKYVDLQNRKDRKAEGLKKLLQLMTEFHFETQKNSLQGGQLGYALPYIEDPLYAKGKFFKSMYNHLSNKLNTAEKGELNYEEQPFVGLGQMVNAWFNGFFEDPIDPSIKKTVPDPYTSYIDESLVSRDLPLILTMFAGTSAKAQVQKELISITELVKDALKDESTGQRYYGSEPIQSRKKKLEAVEYLEESQIYSFNKIYELGKGIDTILTQIRRVNTWASQGNLLGFLNVIKNNMQGRFQNFINSEFANWSDTKSTAKAARASVNLLPKYLLESKKPLNKRSKDYHLISMFMPSIIKDFQNLILSDTNKRFYKNHMNFFLSVMHEFNISITSLYSHLYYTKVQKGNEVKTLYDIITNNPFETDNWVQDGWVDAVTKQPIDKEYLSKTILAFKSVQEYIQGKLNSNIKLSQSTIGSALLYFKSWLIPSLRRRFDTKKANFAIGEDIEGYYRSFGKFIYNFFTEYNLNLKDSWDGMTPEEQRNVKATLKEITILIAGLIIINVLLGFDFDDDDKYTNLKYNNYFHNIAILLTMQSIYETTTLSPIPLANLENKFVPSILTETIKFYERPFIGNAVLKDFYNLTEYTLSYLVDPDNEDNYYKANIPAYNIKKNQLKLNRYFKKVTKLDNFEYLLNPEGKIKSYLNLAARN